MQTADRYRRHLPANGSPRGTVMVFVAVVLSVVFVFCALSVDIGLMVLAQSQLQTAADAAALAGAQAIPQGATAAAAAAEFVAEHHHAGHGAVVFRPAEDFELGRWDEATAAFLPLSGSARKQADTVHVTTRCLTSRGTHLRLFFAPIFGTRSAEVEAKATARIKAHACGRLVGLDWIQMSSGYTDSYDSRLGGYASQTPGSQGNLCSDGPITLQNCTLNGNANPGEGYSTTLQNAIVTGNLSTHPPISAPPVDPTPAALANDNDLIPPEYWDAQGNFKLQSPDTLQLPPGRYYFPRDFILQGTLEITGPTEFYIMGYTNVAGQGLVNPSMQPINLQVYLFGSDYKNSGGSDFYGVVYGPETHVLISGNANFYGSILGRTLAIQTNAGVHFDEALGVLDIAAPKIPRLVE